MPSSPLPLTIRPLLRRTVLRPLVVAWRHRGLRPADVMLASYPRSGSVWTKSMLADLLAGEQVSFRAADRLIPHVGAHHAGRAILPGGGRLIKSHESYRRVYGRSIYLVRDPRDVVISYFGLLSRLPEHTPELSEFVSRWLSGSIGGLGPWDDHVHSWLEGSMQSPVLVVRYEDLTASPQELLGSMLDFLGVEPEPDAIERTIARNDRQRMAERWQRDMPLLDVAARVTDAARPHLEEGQLAAVAGLAAKFPGLGYADDRSAFHDAT